MDEPFPFAKIKIKVLEREPGNLLAVPNVAIRNLSTKEPEYIAGMAKLLRKP